MLWREKLDSLRNAGSAANQCDLTRVVDAHRIRRKCPTGLCGQLREWRWAAAHYRGPEEGIARRSSDIANDVARIIDTQGGPAGADGLIRGSGRQTSIDDDSLDTRSFRTPHSST